MAAQVYRSHPIACIADFARFGYHIEDLDTKRFRASTAAALILSAASDTTSAIFAAVNKLTRQTSMHELISLQLLTAVVSIAGKPNGDTRKALDAMHPAHGANKKRRPEVTPLERRRLKNRLYERSAIRGGDDG